jgi:predicted ATPase
MTPTQVTRIVVSGGPGGGKTTALDLFRREIGDAVAVVPESATLLYAGGFPRLPAARVPSQHAIYHVQRNLEDAHALAYPGRVLLCDRGTIDGAAYWEGPPSDFFGALATTFEDELARYAAVLFFETAAVGGVQASANPHRIESTEQAVAIDRRLRDLWSRHPRFHFVPHDASFLKKIFVGLEALQRITTDPACG